MANDWIDGDPDCQNADHPFHAGVTVDLLEGNTLRAFEQSRYDLQCFHHEYYTMTKSFTTTTFVDLWTEWQAWPLILRKKADGSMRDVTFSLEGKLDTGSETVTVRAYLLGEPLDSPTVDGTDGLGADLTNYGEIEFSTTSYTRKDVTITPDRTAVSRSIAILGDESAGLPHIQPDITFVQLIAKSTAALELTIRAPRFIEVAV